MPKSEPVSILLVNENAEEIKLTTLGFRDFSPTAVSRPCTRSKRPFSGRIERSGTSF